MANPIVIIDLGLGSVKAGLATDKAPTVLFQADPHWFDAQSSESNFGSIISRVFAGLGIAPAGCSVVVTQPSPYSGTGQTFTQLVNVLMRDVKVGAVCCIDVLKAAFYSAGGLGSGTPVLSENNMTIAGNYLEGHGTGGQKWAGCSAGAWTPDWCESLAQMLVTTIQIGDIPERKTYYGNIYLFGAQCTAAVKATLDAVMPETIQTMNYVDYRSYLPVDGDANAAWRGAKALSALDLGQWGTQADYAAGGAQAIGRKLLY